MSQIAELLERVKAATGPDIALDSDIARASGRFVGGHWHNGSWVRIAWFNVLGGGPWELLQPYTASMDASDALVVRMLPGWARGYDAGAKTTIAFVDPDDHADRFLGARHTAEGSTPPLAILAALLTALQQRETK